MVSGSNIRCGVGEASKWHVPGGRGHVLWPAGPSQNLIMPNTRQESEAQATALRAGASCERTMSGDQLSGQVRCRDRILHNPVGLRTYLLTASGCWPSTACVPQFRVIHALDAEHVSGPHAECAPKDAPSLFKRPGQGRFVHPLTRRAALLSELHRRETTAKLAETRAACANRV